MKRYNCANCAYKNCFENSQLIIYRSAAVRCACGFMSKHSKSPWAWQNFFTVLTCRIYKFFFLGFLLSRISSKFELQRFKFNCNRPALTSKSNILTNIANYCLILPIFAIFWQILAKNLTNFDGWSKKCQNLAKVVNFCQ